MNDRLELGGDLVGEQELLTRLHVQEPDFVVIRGVGDEGELRPVPGDGREDLEAALLSQWLDLAARPWLVGVQIEAPDVLASDQAGERQTPGACPRPTQSERRPFVLLGPRGEPRRRGVQAPLVCGQTRGRDPNLEQVRAVAGFRHEQDAVPRHPLVRDQVSQAGLLLELGQRQHDGRSLGAGVGMDNPPIDGPIDAGRKQNELAVR